MALNSTLSTLENTMVGMGQIVAAAKPANLTAILGSCVGVALYHPRRRVGALAHVVLPNANGRVAPPGKFADSAIPTMVQQLESLGANRAGITVKITGGACMFGTSGPLQIGDANVEAVIKALADAGLRVAAKDTGGVKGRRVAFRVDTGELLVEIIGQPPRVL
jgi:chemotaxis protein CheD